VAHSQNWLCRGFLGGQPCLSACVFHANASVSLAKDANHKKPPIVSANKTSDENYGRKEKIRLSLRSFVQLFRFTLSWAFPLAGSHEQRAVFGHSNNAKVHHLHQSAALDMEAFKVLSPRLPPMVVTAYLKQRSRTQNLSRMLCPQPWCAEICAGEMYPICVLFKPLPCGRSAVEIAMQSGVFASVISVVYWAQAQSADYIGETLPRFRSPQDTADVSGKCTWQPEEGTVVDAVGARVTVAVTRGADSLTFASLPTAINARRFVPLALQHRFCSLLQADHTRPPPLSRYILLGSSPQVTHWFSIAAATSLSTQSLLCPITPLVPPELRVLDPPITSRLQQQLPWEPDLVLPLPMPVYAEGQYAPFHTICTLISATQHAVLVQQHGGMVMQRPFAPYVEGLLRQTLGTATVWSEGVDPGSPEIGLALRLLTVEGIAQLEVRC
jgi:hypothetical protein